MKISCQGVNLVLRLHISNKLKTLSEILHHFSQCFVCFVLFLFFKLLLLWIHLGPIVSIFAMIVLKICNLSNVWIVSFNENSLSIFFDLKDIIEHTLVQSIQTIRVLRTFDFCSEIDLSDNQFSQKLKLSNFDNLRHKLS